MDRVILTKEGFEQLKEELILLKTKKRREVADALERARAHGDLRENAEYDAAKLAKQQLESRIQLLEEKLAKAQVLDASDAPTDKVYFGTTVDLKNQKTGGDVVFTFVAEDEADIANGKISIHTPIGKALLGHKVGDVVDVNVPAGLLSFKILKIYRK